MKYLFLLFLLFFLVFYYYFNNFFINKNEVTLIKNFLTNDDCEYIKKVSVNFKKSNTIADYNYLDKTHRNSETCWIDKSAHKIISEIIKKSCDLINYPFEHSEDLQVVKYSAGGFFNEHNDSCFDYSENCKDFHKRGGHRVATLLIALSDPDEYSGGETRFSNLNKNFKLNKGDAILFYNINELNKENIYSKHGGLKINSGEKWIANVWIREYPFK
jgi:prolyl 4-hydroxylase